MKRQRMYRGKEKMIVREDRGKRNKNTPVWSRNKKKLQRKVCARERESEVNVETRRTGEMNRVKWCGTHTGGGMRERRTGKRKSR